MTLAHDIAAATDSFARRFGSLGRLIGEDALARLRGARVTVVGIGGVGSWTVEALARSGVGALTLIDMDHVAESNINRQVLALEATLGAAKAQVMADRVAQISPACRVDIVDDFVTAENAAVLLPDEGVIVDAIDQPRAKAAMIAVCRARGQPLVVCGGAGAVGSPLGLKRGDLALATGDALLASVRARLRREHGFTRKAGERFGVTALYFDVQRAQALACEADAGAPLACSGYGSIVTVTATLGMAAAGVAIEWSGREPRV